MTDTLTTVTDAEKLLAELAETHDWVSVFWDRGWGDDDNPTDISIIVDGHGDEPKAHLTKAAYAALVDSGVVGMFGDRIGDGVTVHFPRGTEPYEYGGLKPDLAAMREPAFREELLAAIRDQLALLPA